VACRSQDKLRHVIPDGVPPGAANLGFRRLSYPRRLDRPSQAVRPARAGSFGELISNHRAIQRTRVFDRKKRQHTFCDSAGDIDLVSQPIFRSLHGITVRYRQEERDHGEYRRTQ
jgi:hypothetical protein